MKTLRDLRLEKNLAQWELAEILGFSQQGLQYVELHGINKKTKLTYALSKFYGIPFEEFRKIKGEKDA